MVLLDSNVENVVAVKFLCNEGGVAGAELKDEPQLPVVRMTDAGGVKTEDEKLGKLLHGRKRMGVVLAGITLRAPCLGAEFEE